MRSRGFTLIEMVITVAIVGLLATAVFPLAELGVRRAKEQDLRVALREIRDGLDHYKAAADKGHIERKPGDSGYPPDLESLVQGVVDIKSPSASKIYFLRRLPRDPFNPDKSVAAADSWVLRSYKSSYEDPHPGEDVFDVRSVSPRQGLNGVPYDQW